MGCFPHYKVVCWDCHREKVEAEYRKNQDNALEEEDAASLFMAADWAWTTRCTIDKEEDKCLAVVQPSPSSS